MKVGNRGDVEHEDELRGVYCEHFGKKYTVITESDVSTPNVITSISMDRITISMMTSSNGNIFRVTGHLCGEFTDSR